MGKKPKLVGVREGTVKLTVEIPAHLHLEAKVQAARTGTTLQAMVVAGLAAQLKGGKR